MRLPDPPPFEVRRSRIQGRGAFATRRIRPGALIIEYTGALIGSEEAPAVYGDGLLWVDASDTADRQVRLESTALLLHRSTGPEVITGGPFGPEAGLILLPALALGAWLVARYTRGREKVGLGG